MDGELLAFLNRKGNYDVLATQKLNDENFAITLIKSKLSDGAFEQLILAVSDPIDGEPIFSVLTTERVDKLIQQDMIALSEYNFNNVKSNHRDLVRALIERNIDDFFNDTISYDLEATDYLSLMESGISLDEKRRLAEEISYTAIQQNTPLAAHVINHFVAFPYVLRSYYIVEALLAQDVLQEQKVILFEKHVQDFDTSQNSVLLAHIGDKFGEINDHSKTPFIPQNPVNRSILEKLQNLDIIRIFPQNRNHYQVFH